MAGWSNGHNTWLSPRQPVFDSPCRRIFVLFFYTYFQSSAQPPDILTFNTVCTCGMTECTIKAQSCGPNNSERTTRTFLKYLCDVTFLMANVGTTKHTWIHVGMDMKLHTSLRGKE